MTEPLRVIGLLSGTSADGIDAALFEISGAPPRLDVRQIASQPTPYSGDLRARVLAACSPATGRVDALCRLNVAIGEAFAQAALDLMAACGVEADLIGSHGQTVWHDVREDGSVSGTLQLGEAAVIAERTGITTVSNFRARDVAAGGQGAPLTAYVDWLLLRHPERWRAVQNIGGIGNVTFLPPLNVDDRPPLAFDTGPGNVLIDGTMSLLTDGAQTYDADGALAAAGRADGDWLESLMEHPYYAEQPPKTTGRELYTASMVDALVQAGRQRGLPAADIVATVTALTAYTILDAYMRYAPAPVEEVIIGGGGVKNNALMTLLKHLLAPARLMTHEALNLSSDAKEALVFALLAHETWHHRTGTLPALTGAAHPTVLGQITPGTNYRPLIDQTWR
jgi:anhydro-N-acetylmuramic acid kinase